MNGNRLTAAALRWFATLALALTSVLTAIPITSVSAQEYSDIAILTTENGQPVYDACYILIGYGNEGCDENRDGKIWFMDIPLGTWTVHQTRDLGPGRAVADFTITVVGNRSSDGLEHFPATVNGSSRSVSTTRTGSKGSSTANTKRVPMMIGATYCDGSGGKRTNCRHAIGAHFTVTTEDGAYLDECTLEGTGQEPYALSCSVQVPKGIVVIVTEDIDSLEPGYAPEENPLRFDTGTKVIASFWGVAFQNSRT